MAFNFFGKRDKDPETPAEPRSFFDRMKQAVTRTRETLADSIGSVIALTREIDEANLDDLEAVLLASDIGSVTTAEIVDNLRARALRQGINDGAELKQLLKAEILRILLSVQKPARHLASLPEVIMMVGVNGTGKTTTSGKLAALYSGEGRSVLLCAADTFRAAAIEQLEVWAERSGVQIVKTRQGGDPVRTPALFDALTAAKARQTGVCIVEPHGRPSAHQVRPDAGAGQDAPNRHERLVPGAPHQTLLVMDATTGQNGMQQARLFTEAARVTGIVLTKLDGTAKGGIVVAIARELGLPVLYAGVGEKDGRHPALRSRQLRGFPAGLTLRALVRFQ